LILEFNEGEIKSYKTTTSKTYICDEATFTKFLKLNQTRDRIKMKEVYGICGDDFTCSREGTEYKGFRVTNNKDNKSSIAPLVCGWDIVTENMTIPLKATCYQKCKDGVIKLRHIIYRDCDAIGGPFIINTSKKPSSIEVGYVKTLKDYTYKYVPLSVVYDDKGYYVITLSQGEQTHLSLLNSTYGLWFEFALKFDDETDIDTFLTETKMTYSKWLYDTKLRSETASKGIDVDTITFD
jgi:hypothetical protein